MTEEQIVSEYEKAQADQINRFKVKMQKAAKEVLGTIYTDVTAYADTDAHINYHNYLKDKFREAITKEVAEDFSHYSWAHSIRMALLTKHKDVLQNKIIEDLQEKIKSQEQHIEQILQRRY